jgi:hypothetical protein
MDSMEADLSDGPALLTIPETAAVLRVAVNTVYELAKRFRVTGGSFGIPGLDRSSVRRATS